MNAAALDRERLVKLCGMFGSDHPGERANAAAAADKLIRSAGMRWPDVIRPPLPAPPRLRPVNTAAEAIRFVLQHADALTDWERDFAQSIARQQSPLTPKQRAVLDRLIAKAQRAEAKAA